MAIVWVVQADPEQPFFGEGQDILHSDKTQLATWEKLVGTLREIQLVLITCVNGAFHEVKFLTHLVVRS